MPMLPGHASPECNVGRCRFSTHIPLATKENVHPLVLENAQEESLEMNSAKCYCRHERAFVLFQRHTYPLMR